MMKNFIQSKARGFTLIELLVVIAIIGILAGIVLASLSTARSGASGAKIKEELSSLRTSGEIYYGAHSNKYQTGAVAITACSGGTAGDRVFNDTSSGGAGLVASITNAATAVDCGINAAGSAWSMAATMPDGSYWCVDSSGASKGTQGTGTTGYTALTGAGTAAHTAAGATVCN